ncbi:MAG TPA: hydrogenase maturation peptidase HycI [Dehalococcoidia bacterium]|nr:hydrogenase maturation peptidase HycI [Dehalococcoidia bacterium]
MRELILGIGNMLKGDDGIGIYVAEMVNKRLKEIEGKSRQVKFREAREAMVINCGTTPENYTSIIRKYAPDRLILVDAADMGLSPGSYRIIPPGKIGVMCVSTHNMPLSLFVSYVSEFCRDIVLIGVQPERMDFGATLSSVARRAGGQVVNLIIEKRLNEIETLKV